MIDLIAKDVGYGLEKDGKFCLAINGQIIYMSYLEYIELANDIHAIAENMKEFAYTRKHLIQSLKVL